MVEPVNIYPYCRRNDGFMPVKKDDNCNAGKIEAGVTRDKREGGLSFYGPATVLKASAEDSPYKATLEFMDKLETAADANGGRLEITMNSGKKEVLQGKITFEHLVEIGLLAENGQMTDLGQRALGTLSAPTQPKQAAAGKIGEIRVDNYLANKGIVFSYADAENVVDHDDIPKFEGVGAQYPTEVRFNNFSKYLDLDSYGNTRTTNLINSVNALREAHPDVPIRLVVDGSNTGAFIDQYGKPYDLKVDSKSGIKYAYVAEGKKQYLVIGVNQDQLKDASIVGKMREGAYELPAAPPPPGPLADNQIQIKLSSDLRASVLYSTVPADQFSGANQTNYARKIKSGNSDIIIVQGTRQLNEAEYGVLKANLAQILPTIPATTVSAQYDPKAKKATVSFREGTSDIPAKQAHIAKVMSGDKELVAGKDYTVNPDGTLTGLKSGEYKIYLKIGGYVLDEPAKVTIAAPRAAAAPKAKGSEL